MSPVSRKVMAPVFPIDIALPARGDGPIAQSLHVQLRLAISEGRLPTGFELPATRRVAEAFRISRNTVVAAYDLLVAEGLIAPRKSAKAVVVGPLTRHDKEGVQFSKPVATMWRDSSLRESPRVGLPPHSFRLGIPDHRFFPHEEWRRLCAHSLRAWSRTPFSYAPSEGILELRSAIAGHVAFTRAVSCVEQDVVVTSGAQQAFDLIARLLIEPGRKRVAVEEPGYPGHRNAFRAAGAELVHIEVDDEGIVVDDIPEDVCVVCVTPSHHSPTGVVMSLRRRAALLAKARDCNMAILEDDYDGEFRFGQNPLDALQTLDRDASVLYVGTFAKSLFPSLRKGFIVAPPWARDGLITIKSCADAHCDTMTQSVLAAFIREGHLVRHVRRMQGIYAERREALLHGLRTELSAWLEVIPSESGMHLSAKVRDERQAGAILAAVQRFTPGAQSSHEYAARPLARTAITFGYGVIDASEIADAIQLLARALQRI